MVANFRDPASHVSDEAIVAKLQYLHRCGGNSSQLTRLRAWPVFGNVKPGFCVKTMVY